MPRKKGELVRIGLIYLVCDNCGYKWAPQPWRWTNFSTVKNSYKKSLPCPDCGAKVRISPKKLLEILEKNKYAGKRRFKLERKRSL